MSDEELRALAEAAVADGDFGRGVAKLGRRTPKGRYMDAANPRAVLALLDRALAAEAAVARVAAQSDEWIEWGVRRTWGDVGSISPMDRRTAEKCAHDWPAQLVCRTVRAEAWEAVER